MTAATILQEAPAIATGIAAALCLTAAPAFRRRRMILLAQLAAGLFFAAHYIFLGIAVAGLVNVLGAVQTAAALSASRNPVMNRLGYVLIILMTGVGLWFWQGPVSALSVAAMVLIALGRMQTDQLWLRLLLLAGGGFWIVHDFIAGAWIALAADFGAAAIGATALFALYFRVTVEWRPATPAFQT